MSWHDIKSFRIVLINRKPSGISMLHAQETIRQKIKRFSLCSFLSSQIMFINVQLYIYMYGLGEIPVAQSAGAVEYIDCTSAER